MKSIQSKHLGLSPLLQRAIALVGLILISPVLLITALLIRLESPGSPIFTQTRVGLHGRRFAFYKFRSMRVASDPKYVDVSTIKSDRDGVCKKLF
ncbi:sugar transferase, partial [Oleiphilus sp. HI0080]